MKRLFTATDLVLVGHLKSVLTAHRVACVIRNEFLSGAVGDLPWSASWPELWILDEREESLAKRLINQILDPEPVTSAVWSCPVCHEVSAPQFELCWQCGEARPATNQHDACGDA